MLRWGASGNLVANPVPLSRLPGTQTCPDDKSITSRFIKRRLRYNCGDICGGDPLLSLV